jgi:hypothetical protein
MYVCFLMSQKEGKKNNIRALLCSLHTVVWEGAKWNKCDMHQLVSAADVKKAYRKACLAVHPDKVSWYWQHYAHKFLSLKQATITVYAFINSMDTFHLNNV